MHKVRTAANGNNVAVFPPVAGNRHPSLVQKANAQETYSQETNARVKLEVSADTLARLINQGLLNIGEFRCLDCDAKQCVRELFLHSCPFACDD